MSNTDFQFWDIFATDHGGYMTALLMCVLISALGVLFGVVSFISAKKNQKGIGYPAALALLSLGAAVIVVLLGVLPTFAAAEKSHIEVLISQQIEETYDLKVQSFDWVKMNDGYEVPEGEITKVSGIVEMERIGFNEEEGFEPKFKFSMKQGEKLVLSPTDSHHPDNYLKQK